jgi:hypothetical protein
MDRQGLETKLRETQKDLNAEKEKLASVTD